MQMRPLEEQTIVITGASSGIGLSTARIAAERGARVVLASRNAEALTEAVTEIRAAGGQALAVVADVGRREDVERIADEAIAVYGGFDTWVNNAGVTVFGTIERIAMEDHRRLFETNFWGLVHGSIVAARHLRERGGTIINIGSALSDRSIPLQGMYSASKHAVKGFTDAFRMELEHDDAPIATVLIKPASIATRYVEHGKNYLEEEPRLPPPVYAPEVVAEAILHCAVHPRRDLHVGSASRMFAFMEHVAPRVTDHVMEWTLYRAQSTGEADQHEGDVLHGPRGTRAETRGGHARFVRHSSHYTRAKTHPMRTFGSALGVGALCYIGYKMLA